MSSHIAISTESGQVYVAGSNSTGQLSLGTINQTNTFTLAKMDPSINISSIIQATVGSAHTIMLRSTGNAYSCGLNTNGQLGLGTTLDTSFIEVVLASATSTLGNINAVSAGAFHSLFLLSDGSAVACGLNTSNQLGDGTTTQRNYPVNVLKSAGVFLNPVASIAGGTSHSVFAATDGTAWCCGDNTQGQIGDGTKTTRAYATQVKTGVSTFLSNVSQVVAGDTHSIALTASGSVYSWGRNNNGQLALGTTTDTSYATQSLYAATIPMNNIILISSCANHSLFLTASGTVYACGLNANGQLGDGTFTNRLYPVIVSTAAGVPLTDIVSVGTSGNQSYFIKADGRVYACGYGQTGGLGNGTLVDSSYAIPVLSSNQSVMKSYGYSAAYWRSQGVSASTLVSTGGFGAYDLVNGGYNKTDLSNAGFTIANIANAGIQDLYAMGYTHNEIVNGANVALTKMGQLSVASSKLGTLMSGGLYDAPRAVSVSGRDVSSISIAITAPSYSTGLTGYSVTAIPVTGGSTVSKSLAPNGTLVNGLAAGKIYDLQVRSTSAAGNSVATTIRNSSGFNMPALSVGTITPSSIDISFSSALATQDCSYVLRTAPNVAEYVLSAGATAKSLTGLAGGTSYTIYLDASNAYMRTSSTTSATTTIDLSMPGFVDLYSSLTLHYRFDNGELSGSNIYNSAPNKLLYDGTKIGTGSISTTTKKFGTGSYDLTGSTSYTNRIQIAAVNFSSNSVGSSVSLWIYIPYSQAAYQSITYYGELSSGYNTNSYILTKGDGTGGFANKFFSNTGNQGNQAWSTTLSYSTNTWYHIVWIFGTGGSSSGTGDKLYVNGTSYGAINSGTNRTNATNNYIGGTSGWANEYIKGYIDDYRLYSNKELTQDEVNYLYSMGNSTASFTSVSVSNSGGNALVSWTGTNISYVGVCQYNSGTAYKLTTSGTVVPITTGNKLFVVPYDSSDRAGMASTFFTV